MSWIFPLQQYLCSIFLSPVLVSSLACHFTMIVVFVGMLWRVWKHIIMQLYCYYRDMTNSYHEEGRNYHNISWMIQYGTALVIIHNAKSEILSSLILERCTESYLFILAEIGLLNIFALVDIKNFTNYRICFNVLSLS